MVSILKDLVKSSRAFFLYFKKGKKQTGKKKGHKKIQTKEIQCHNASAFKQRYGHST